MIQVLLIEDSDSDAELVKRLLRGSEFSVFQTARAAQAERFLRTQETDLILLDLKLPNGDGLDLINRIVKVSRDAPVIILTGHDTDTILSTQAIDNEGAVGFLSKNNLSEAVLLANMKLAWKAKQEALKKQLPTTVDVELVNRLNGKMNSIDTHISELETALKKKAGR